MMKFNELFQNLIQWWDSAQPLMKIYKEHSQYFSVLIEKIFIYFDQVGRSSDRSVRFI
jgi:hypothetical protein